MTHSRLIEALVTRRIKSQCRQLNVVGDGIDRDSHGRLRIVTDQGLWVIENNPEINVCTVTLTKGDLDSYEERTIKRSFTWEELICDRFGLGIARALETLYEDSPNP